MSEQSSGLSGFVAELKRRHVFRTFIAYGAAAFVVLQGAEIVLPAFDVGDWVLQLIVVLCVLGLPVVLALAWVYEITPRGIRTMRELDVEGGRKVEEGSLLPRVALLFVTVLAAGGAGTYWVRTSVPGVEGGAAEASDVAAAPAFRAADDQRADVPIRSLAVLPLQSYSPPSAGEAGAAEGDYFAAGMHEALISQLSRVGASFRVISRTTVQQYDATGRSIAQIGEDLGVEGIVEGSVVLDGDRVRITVQLIHAPSDDHLWSADYERELEDIIALQREVATAIAGAILGELDEPASGGEVLAASDEPAPGADPEAAMAEMRGRAALSAADEGDEAAVEEAVRQFEVALAEDSSYAPALVGLAGSTLMRELSTGVPSAEVLERVRAQIEKAVRVDPDNAEARDLRTVLGRLGPEPGDVRAPPAPPAVTTDLGARIVVMTHEGGRIYREARLESARTLRSVGRMDQARKMLDDLVHGHPDYEPAWQELEHLLASAGRVSEVVELRERRRAAGAGSPVEGGPTLDALADAVEERGARGYWTWRLNEIEARREAGLEVSALDEATALAALGRAGPALDALRAAAEAGSDLRTLRSDPVWDPLRRDPAFRELMRKVFERGFDWRFETPGGGQSGPGG